MAGFKRGSEDVPSWIGYDNLLSYYNKCPTDEHKKIFCFLFETGGRVSEIIELKPEQFVWNSEVIVIEKMLVLKYRQRKTRQVVIKRDDKDALTETMISFLEDCNTDYIFPRHMQFTGEIIPHQHTSRVRIYNLVREISDDLFPHWFRSMRASFMVYVRKLNVFELKTWFEWKSMDTPGSYVKGMEIAEKLGIKELPQPKPFIRKPFIPGPKPIIIKSKTWKQSGTKEFSKFIRWKNQFQQNEIDALEYLTLLQDFQKELSEFDDVDEWTISVVKLEITKATDKLGQLKQEDKPKQTSKEWFFSNHGEE